MATKGLIVIFGYKFGVGSADPNIQIRLTADQKNQQPNPPSWRIKYKLPADETAATAAIGRRHPVGGEVEPVIIAEEVRRVQKLTKALETVVLIATIVKVETTVFRHALGMGQKTLSI